MNKENDSVNGDEKTIIELYDDTGESINCELLDEIVYMGETYYIMAEVIDTTNDKYEENAADVLIMKLVDGCLELEYNSEVLNSIFDQFKRRNINKYKFASADPYLKSKENRTNDIIQDIKQALSNNGLLEQIVEIKRDDVL